mgnify:CR=1 FL=1
MNNQLPNVPNDLDLKDQVYTSFETFAKSLMNELLSQGVSSEKAAEIIDSTIRRLIGTDSGLRDFLLEALSDNN